MIRDNLLRYNIIANCSDTIQLTTLLNQDNTINPNNTHLSFLDEVSHKELFCWDNPDWLINTLLPHLKGHDSFENLERYLSESEMEIVATEKEVVLEILEAGRAAGFLVENKKGNENEKVN
jgi:hypothetical protein